MKLFSDKQKYNYELILPNAPGPSPWFLIRAGPKLISKYGPLYWKEAGKREPRSGKVLLTTMNDDPLAIFNRFCYVIGVEQNLFLTWYSIRKYDLKSSIPKIELAIINVEKLSLINNIDAACREMAQNNLNTFYNKDSVKVSFTILGNMKLGLNKMVFPEEFRIIDELIIFGECTSIRKKPFLTIQENLALYILKPKESFINIVPQDWYNYGKYDFDYQAPTRAIRDPVSGRIFGDGIRIGKFVLDESGRNIEKWFYNKNSNWYKDYME